MKTSRNAEATAVRDVLRGYHEAMVEGSTVTLNELLDSDFELVHMSGYVQPKDEWLHGIETDEFVYHAIQLDDALDVRIGAGTAEIAGRGVFDATVYGMRRGWRMRFTVRMTERQGGWIITRGRYISDERRGVAS